MVLSTTLLIGAAIWPEEEEQEYGEIMRVYVPPPEQVKPVKVDFEQFHIAGTDGEYQYVLWVYYEFYSREEMLEKFEEINK